MVRTVRIGIILLLCARFGWAADPVLRVLDPDQPAEMVRAADAQPGVRRVEAGNATEPSSFEVVLGDSPETMARAFLVYELAGVSHWTATVRSINGLPALGGFGAVPSSGTAVQVEEINPRWLHPGSNQIVFAPAPASDVSAPSGVTSLRPRADSSVPYTVRNLRLVYLEGPAQPSPRLQLSYPLQGENDEHGAILRGFVDPPGLPSGPAELFVNEVYLPQAINLADGSFAVFVPRTAPEGEGWEARIEVVYPDGTRLRKTVALAAKKDTDADDDSAELDADVDGAHSLSLDDALLELTPGALRRRVKITMRRLRREDLPALDSGMTNVTPDRRGFRMGPHGLRFSKQVRLRLPYDPELIPKGMTAADVRTFYFDEAAGRWFPLPRAETEGSSDIQLKESAEQRAIVSLTNHFTDFINATLAVPDAPGSANYAPNSLEELAKGEPASRIIQIAPPEGDATGDATLSFPLVVPPGRLGMQPNLTVRYNSSGGNGWLGVGWSLDLPSIEIWTAFGVPDYDGTERYLIDGEQLVPSSDSTGSSGKVFLRRVEGSYDRIVRRGLDPERYWWEVTDKNGTRRIYGRTDQARLRDPVQRNTGNVFRWYLEQEIDLHGNTVDYVYHTDQGGTAPLSERWGEVYPERIDYTGVNGSGAYYHVYFQLDEGNRPDRISSGRPGFKTYMRHRLASVEVRAGDAVVRRYDFTYREGDFRKSLLETVAVKGEDGTTELYRHKFNYAAMPAQGDGYAGFSAPLTWGGMASAEDFTVSSRLGGGGHAFVGLGTTICQPHAGAQLGGSGTDSTESVMFLDVNGDGLPDRFHDNGAVDLNQYDPATDDGSHTGRFQQVQFDNADTPGHTSEWGIDFSLGVHAEAGFTASVEESWAWTYANEDRMLTDLNGDLRPDLVSTKGGFHVRRNNGSSFVSEDWNGFGGGLNLSTDGEESEVLKSAPLANPVRALTLPWAGNVIISGAIQKKESLGDGVDVAIYKNGFLGWTHHFEGTDTAPCTPGSSGSCRGGLTFDVQDGDTLYFLASSIRDTDGDALLWAPVVTYNGADPQAREPHGVRSSVFDAAEDFALAGYNGASWSASVTGSVRVTGAFVKQETSDDVTVTIAKRMLDNLSFPIDVKIFERTFAANEQTSFEDFPTTGVFPGQHLILRVTSATPIDPRRIQWTPSVTYESVNYQGMTKPADLPDDIRTSPAQVSSGVAQWNGFKAMQSWTPPSTGEQTLHVSCSLVTIDGTGTFYVQGINRLLVKHELTTLRSEFPVTFSTTAGEPLFLTLVSPTAAVLGACFANTGSGPFNLGSPVPVNLRTKDVKSESVNLSGGYHGWRYGEWSSNSLLLFRPDLLTPPKDKKDQPSATPGVPRWQGTRNVKQAVWTGGGFDLSITAEGVKPSRVGYNAAGMLSAASGGSGAGLSILRKTSGKTTGLSVSSGIGLALSRGTSRTVLDLLDMNGDGYPDQVSPSGVRYSDGKSGFGPLKTFEGFGSSIRSDEDGNVSNSIGLGINVTRRDGAGKPSSVASFLPSVGKTISLSHTDTTLIDVNGDGLPDRVTMQPGSGTVFVQLHLGHRFGRPELWTLPPLSPSQRCNDAVDYVGSQLGDVASLDTLNGLSFTRSAALNAGVAVGPIGTGTSTTLSRTLVELIDVNGDGLPDRVAKDHGDPYFRVQINLGEGWDSERRWYVPGWPAAASIGDGYNPGGIFQCLDAVSFSGNIEVQGSGGAPFCIPLLLVGIQVELSAQGFSSLGGGVQLFMQDIDGDGLADHILKKGKDSSVYVKRNQAGGANLLTSIERPLGSTVEISYQRRGNTTDDPYSHWALAAVTVKEGHGGVSTVTRFEYGNDAYYDRAERENYGYGGVRITLPDGSKIARVFQNRDFYSRHLQTKEVLTDKDGKLFRVETSRYQQIASPYSTFSRFPALVETKTDFYEGTTSVEQGVAPKSTKMTYAYDANGNLTFMDDSSDDSDLFDNVATTIAYQFDAATRLTRPTNIEVRDGSLWFLRGRRGAYNATGDLIRLERLLGSGFDPQGASYEGNNNPAWTFVHDELGNRTVITDPNGNVSKVTYETQAKMYPRSVTDSFGYVTGYTYDLKYGELAATTDQNGNTISRTYDAFGRLLRVVGPYDDAAAPALSFDYGRGGSIAWAVVHHKDSAHPGNPIDSAVFIDSLERVIQTKEEAELDLGTGSSTSAGMRVSGLVAFDELGRVISRGQPVFDTKPASELVTVASKNPTTFTYDALDRVRKVRFPYQNAATSMDYDFAKFDGTMRFRTTRTDPKGRVTRFYRDVHQNVVGVQQVGAQKTLTTRYAYDAIDQLKRVTDPKGSATTLQHDTLGHIIVLSNPDLGSTDFRYDPAGNLRVEITANLRAANQQIRYSYTYGRLDRIDYPQSPDVVYTYGGPGAPSNRANRIVTITDGSGTEERSYGKLGELIQTTRTPTALLGVAPGAFTTKFAYDDFARLLSVVYPDGDTLTYGYDAGGKVKSATTSRQPGSVVSHLRHMGYDEFGDRVRMVLGNSVETRYKRDAASRFLTGLTTTRLDVTLQDLKYSYDSTGTMLSLQNAAPAADRGGPITEDFQYDDFVQLIGAQGTYNTGATANKALTSTYALSLGYDDLGNITAKNQLHQTRDKIKQKPETKTTYNWTYTYTGSQPHAPTTIGDRTFTYDLNGNQTGWTSDGKTTRVLTWDEQNRLTAVADNGKTTLRFAYDAEGARTNKAGSKSETFYINQWLTVRDGTSSKHVFADDVRISTTVVPASATPNVPGGVYYYSEDHLGSTNFVTNPNGAVFQHLEYFPTGEIWADDRADTTSTPYLFSGKELDDETGLSYFGHRYYDGRQSQWISADPILDEMVDGVESTNLSPRPFRPSGSMTAYVSNDPLNYVDRDGLAPDDLTYVKLSQLPKPRTYTTARLQEKWTSLISELVSDFGDKTVGYHDPKSGRREMDFQEFAYQEGSQKAVVNLENFGVGSTRDQHFRYADKDFGARIGRKFDRSVSMKAKWKTADNGTWHHHPRVKSIAFVPRKLHKYIGHSGGYKHIFNKK